MDITADSFFGPAPENAVKQFQAQTGLAEDGIVGPGTLEASGLSEDDD
ncbi:MAG: peptidoglycan-binding protein [Cyanothece sp. SIO1E1]|nr:peptidoglycan-binding protein [Cyanothece sp. SIO1E1]